MRRVRVLRRRGDLLQWQCHLEGGAAAWAFADFDRAAVRRDQLADDVEPEPRPEIWLTVASRVR